MELALVTQLVVLKAAQNTLEKLDSAVSFVALLLKIVHRPWCEQFHMRTIFFLYHHAGANVHLLVDGRPMLLTGQDVNSNGVLLCRAVILA